MAFMNSFAKNWNDAVLTLDEQDKELERGTPMSEPGIYAQFHMADLLASDILPQLSHPTWGNKVKRSAIGNSEFGRANSEPARVFVCVVVTQ